MDEYHAVELVLTMLAAFGGARYKFERIERILTGVIARLNKLEKEVFGEH